MLFVSHTDKVFITRTMNLRAPEAGCWRQLMRSSGSHRYRRIAVDRQGPRVSEILDFRLQPHLT